MSSQTPNLNLTLPIGTEKVSRQIINENMTKIDQYCGAINQATYRPIPVTITVNDWVQSGGNWVYNFTTAYITESSDEWFMFSSSLADYAKAHIFAEKKSGGGGAVFTTAIKPTGAISCMIRVFDNDDHKVPVLMEGTVLPYANGGTNASTLNGAKENLGINALSTQIGMKNTSIKSTSISNTDTITNIDCSSYRYVLVKFSGNDSNYRSFLFPVTNNDVSQEVNIDANASIYIHLVFRLSFYDKKMYINSIQLGTWGACGLSIIGVE